MPFDIFGVLLLTNEKEMLINLDDLFQAEITIPRVTLVDSPFEVWVWCLDLSCRLHDGLLLGTNATT